LKLLPKRHSYGTGLHTMTFIVLYGGTSSLQFCMGKLERKGEKL